MAIREGFNGEANLNYLLSPEWLLQGGYRFQLYPVKPEGIDETFKDVFHGLTIGPVYTIRDI